MNATLRADAEKAARALVPAPDIHEVVVCEASPSAAEPSSVRLTVRVLLCDESERCFEYCAASDGGPGKITELDCGTNEPLPDFHDPP
jgi:hypothetical protein